MIPYTTRRCANCDCWRSDPVPTQDGEYFGQCLRHAPRPVHDPSEKCSSYDPVWPWTQSTDRCGDWQHPPARDLAAEAVVAERKRIALVLADAAEWGDVVGRLKGLAKELEGNDA